MILSIDVGKGTEDVLLLNKNGPIENSIQLVFPSTAQLLKKKLESDKADKIIIGGELMAGEPWHKIVYERSKDFPDSVIMSTTAARSLRYDLDQVITRGIKIVEDDEISNYEGSYYHLSDINWERIESVIIQSGYSTKDISKVLLCCQDHGEPIDKKQSVRDFRIKTIYKGLEKNGKLEDLLIRSDKIIAELPRHQSISQSALKFFNHLNPKDIFIMDSSPAVALGAISDKNKELIINIGNGHTLAVFLQDSIVQAIYEMHTGGITAERLIEDLKLLSQNKLTHEETLARGGHGIYIRTKLNYSKKQFDNLFPITLIGPNRNKLTHLNVNLVHPAGNMMMAGPVGMILAYNSMLKPTNLDL